MSPLSQKRFLIIDDNKAARDTLRIVAQSIGAFEVVASNGYQDAIYRIRNNPPDIVLCDYVFGDDRNGQQLLEEIRRFGLLRDECVFIMVTGEQEYEQVVSAVELVPDDYIIKPFSPEKLKFRLSKTLAKKEFFSDFYQKRRSKDYIGALKSLDAALTKPGGGIYRFEILRLQAETLLLSQNNKAAELAYMAILEVCDLPWARAGVARSLHAQERHDEAREAVETVVKNSPFYFDAFDLKADICISQGRPDDAQNVLSAIAAKTPRNYARKRKLAAAAMLNGDSEAAVKAMEDVIQNDTVPGAISVSDKIALARTLIDNDDFLKAQKTLDGISQEKVSALSLDEKVSYASLYAACDGNGLTKGGLRQFRETIEISDISSIARLDVLRAALAIGDNMLAEKQTKQLLLSKDSKQSFVQVRRLYSTYKEDALLKAIQKDVALAAIKKRDPVSSLLDGVELG